MHVILTHEQADFDAVAAAMGAFLLNDRALPVLPRRMNRNVRSFLTLYGAELPFIEPRDIPPGSIRLITLVDTQALVTLKGMGQNTSVEVIDHHQQRADIPANWTIRTEKVGACTSLMVERLQESNGASLTEVQASLLLLGIYEDTGSLTYAGTTVRDMRAAAFLMEQGANLRIVGDYLNPPLSTEQRQLYDRLLTSSEPHHINAQNIIIAYANAENLTEEISSVAHKLRDLLDPDALFLLVATSDGVRMVARSTSDQVDVSAVAAHFGGGGHERAAAALVKSNTGEHLTVNQVYRELVEILPRFVRPSIIVGSIMSRQPRLLTPDTPAGDAAQLMQRYGYEGYPVVKDGKVIGLLTRRAVDRALAHKLNLPASRLMESGEVTIHPHDSLEQLQRLMTSSGWGQIPVVDPESGNVIGIVTRTDLLKTLTGTRALLPGKLNLASRLEAALAPTRLAFLQMIAEKAKERGQAIYIVGGFVRDLLLDRPSIDFDLVVEGDAIALARALTGRFGGRMTSHSRFGTAKWQIADIRPALAGATGFPKDANPLDLPESLDLISARTEFYDYPTALPTVERSSIKLDLHRRDFTINTLAMRLDGRHYGELYDYWGGLGDLRQGLVRVLHSLSFVDDPTRLLRAVRFEQRFGFRIEARTYELMESARELLQQVSGDRLRHELNLILSEENAAGMLTRLKELGLLRAIHSELDWDENLAAVIEHIQTLPPDPAWNLPVRYSNLSTPVAAAYLAWLGRCPAEQQRSVIDRLRFSRTLANAMEQVSRLWKELHELRGASPSRFVSVLDSAPPLVLYVLSQMGPSEEVTQMLEGYMRVLRHIQPYTSGDDLRALGIPPGPGYRQILVGLRSAWLDGSITSPDEEKALLEEFLQNLPPASPDAEVL